MKSFIAVSICLLFATSATAGKRESWYQNEWCPAIGGTQEVTMPGGTRADCVTDTHVIEMDFARKWSESVGQSLFYSFQTGKRGGIALILKKPKERRFWYRLNSVIEANQLPIDAWLIGPDGKEIQ